MLKGCGGTMIVLSSTGPFEVGDLVLRRKHESKDVHKLASPWEGPFIVKCVSWPGSYRLMTQDGVEVPNSWNIEYLRRFYP